MRAVESALEGFASRIIEHATLAAILQGLGYKRVNDKIVQLKNRGVLTPLKSGYYLYNPINPRTLVSKEIIANVLLGPSYLSLDYALWFHGLIPESVYEITSITTKRSKRFETALGVFSYKQIDKELFNIGIEIKEGKSGNFLMASRERALCDKVYFTKDIALRSQSAMMEFLEGDLRIDLDEFRDAEMDIFKDFLSISKSGKVEILIKIIKELKR